jgi:hypothetical protein
LYVRAESSVKAGGARRGRPQALEHAMKKKITLDLSEEKALTARRRARRAIGPVKPLRVEQPAPRKSPKHKKKQDDAEFRGE